MKFFRASLLACAIAAFSGTALASSGSLVEFKPKVMPVVVQVNAQGQVTDILPSEQLRPQFRKMLINQLDAWIVKPAMVKGQPVDSRFIIEVALHTKARKDGKYDANFVYVKSLPMPFAGLVHWNIINGGLEVALVSDDADSGHYEHYFFQNEPQDWYGEPVRLPRSATAAAVGQPHPASIAAHPMPAMPTMMPVRSSFSATAPMRSAGTPRAERP